MAISEVCSGDARKFYIARIGGSLATGVNEFG
jgi:hypothetical protein